MSLTPYQQSIWLTMWARILAYCGAAFLMIAALPVMGVRFMDHQILTGLIVGALLIFAGDRVIRHLPDLDKKPAKSEDS